MKIAYLFERFPSFTQTFCYREVRELFRQSLELKVFSIRWPKDEHPQDWDEKIANSTLYLPEEAGLVEEIRRDLRKGKLSSSVGQEIENWGRQTDFLRLYQAAYVGSRLQAEAIPHLHAHFAGLAARTAFWIKKFFGIPFSFTAHANDIFAPRPFAIGLDQLIEAASFIVTESDHAAEFLRKRYPTAAGKIHRVYNGLALSDFPAADFSASVPSIISIGRLIEKKGFADLIEACRLLKERGHKFRCQIIGEGPLAESLRAQIDRSGFEARQIELTGALPQKEIKRRLAGANLFVLPCQTEAAGGMDNLPTVIMEAMAAGLPVVSTTTAGVPEMVEANVTGELVSPNEPEAVTAAMVRLLDDPARARQFGERGRVRAQEKFAVEKSAQELIALFASMVPTVHPPHR